MRAPPTPASRPPTIVVDGLRRGGGVEAGGGCVGVQANVLAGEGEVGSGAMSVGPPLGEADVPSVHKPIIQPSSAPFLAAPRPP